MNTLLVLSPHPDFAEAVKTALSPDKYRIIHRTTAEEGEPLLVHGLVNSCILDADLLGVESVWVIERLRRRDANTPIIAYTSATQSDWEEEAFLRGDTHVLTKPIRARLLNSVLERLASPAAVMRPPLPPTRPDPGFNPRPMHHPRELNPSS